MSGGHRDPAAGSWSSWPRSGGTRGEDDGGCRSSSGAYKKSNALRAPLNIPKVPRKLGRRPPLKGNKRETLEDIARRVPVETMRPYFNYPLRLAADAMCISVTSLKRLCRRHGVKRWPHRQLSGLNRAVSHLEAKQQTSSDDPSIAEQLTQLYSRRDLIINHAFVMDDTNSELTRDSPSRSDREDTEKSVEDSGPITPGPTDNCLAHEESPGDQDKAPTPTSFSGSPDVMIPWWKRDPGTNPWPEQQQPRRQQQQEQRSSNCNYHYDRGNRPGEGAITGGQAASREERPSRDWGNSRRSPDSSGGGRAVEACGGEGNFRSSASGLLRLPGMPPCPPRSSALANAPRSRIERHPAGGSLQGSLSQPVAGGNPSGALSWPPASNPFACAASTNVVADATDRASKGVGTTPNRGRGAHSWSRSANFASLPPQHASDNIETQMTKISALNALLLDSGAKAGAAAAAAAKAAPSGTLAPRGEPAFRDVGGTHGPFIKDEAGGEGGIGQSDNGPLPSIARLVEASALLSGAGGGEWRYGRAHASFRRHVH